MATTRDIRIGLKVDGIDATRQDFKAIATALGGLGVGGEQAATEITKSFAQIQASSAKVAASIERDGKFSQTALDRLIADFVRTRDAVDRAYPTGAPDALSTALATAEARIRATIAAADALPASLDAARNAFRTLESAPSRVEVATRRMEAAIDDYRKKLDTTGDVGKGDIEKIWKAQILLNQELEDAGTTVTQLGTEYEQRFAQMETATNKAAGTVKKLEVETDKLKATQLKANEQFTGFGDALSKLDPKMAAMVGHIGGITGAFTAGWTIGQKLNDFFKTDMQEWDDLTAGVSLKSSALMKSMFDVFIESNKQWIAVVTNNEKAYQEAVKATEQALKEGAAAATKSQQDYLNEAATKLEEQQKLKDAEEGLTGAINGTSTAIDHLIGNMRLLAPAGALNSAQMEKLAGELEAVLANTDRLEPAERQRLQTLIDTARNIETLTTEEKAHFEQELKLVDELNVKRIEGQGITIKWSDAAKQAASEISSATGVATESTIKWSDATKNSEKSADAAAAVLRRTADALKDAAPEMDNLGEGTKQLSNVAPKTTEAIVGLEKGVRELSVSAPKAATAMSDFGEGVRILSTEGPKANSALSDMAKTLEKMDPKLLNTLNDNLKKLTFPTEDTRAFAEQVANLTAKLHDLDAATLKMKGGGASPTATAPPPAAPPSGGIGAGVSP